MPRHNITREVVRIMDKRRIDQTNVAGFASEVEAIAGDISASRAGRHAHVYHLNLTPLVDGAKTEFLLPDEFEPETLHVFVGGALKVLTTDYTEGTYYDTFTMTAAPSSPSTLVVAYHVRLGDAS